MDDKQFRDRLIEKLKRELGSVIVSALEDPNVIEVMLNPDGSLWVVKFGVGKRCVGEIQASRAESIVSTVAAYMQTTVNYDRPGLECELPIDGSRFTALAPPVVAAVSFTIRKKATRIFTLQDYLEAGILTQAQFDYLWLSVANRRNIIVAGGTSSGKTTLLNAIIAAISTQAPDDRLVVIEDTGEVQCAAEDAVPMRAVDHFTMNDCLKKTLRFTPDRIVVGEVRSGEAMALLKSWNTGHEGGASTLHANPGQALKRLQTLVSEAPEASNYTPDMICGLIGEAVNVVVSIAKDKEAKAGRSVKEILEIQGYDAESHTFRSRCV
jgi:type IV secretion system protein TrbB